MRLSHDTRFIILTRPQEYSNNILLLEVGRLLEVGENDG